jgi:23S rRNA pseudouridine2605 synthase
LRLITVGKQQITTMSNQPFKKFIAGPESGAKKKERIRQEKKKLRQETKEYFEKKKQEEREARAHGAGYKPQGTRDKSSAYAKAPADKQDRKAPRHSGNKSTGYGKSARGGQNTKGKSATYGKASTYGKPSTDRPAPKQATDRKPQSTGSRPSISKQAKPAIQPQNQPAGSQATNSKPTTSAMPLNKYIAHSGICSRRDAADVVKSGKVMVNGQKIIEPGHKVTDKDEVKVNGKKITIRRNLVYILLNKPKDFITTTEDPQGRKTVLDIVKQATPERVYPIGRLDRNTTGVLLLTNDGELAQKLSHPSYEVRKIYEVKLDKPLVKKDFDALLQGITLEDGFIAPDALAYADSKDKSIIGIEIHSGRNRIVRRIFEHLGYDVRNLDRVMYGNLTKKNVDRGKWRFLSEKEIRLLKFLNTSFTKKQR